MDIFKEKEEKTAAQRFGELIGTIGWYFLTAAFIYWGWDVIAPHLNAPLFTYWEMFLMRMGAGTILSMIGRGFRKN